MTKAIEASLKRLRLERIDVYQLHVPDPAVSFDASMETLARAREQGKIRHVALSNVAREYIERARKIVPIATVQNRYSFADREWDLWSTTASRTTSVLCHGRPWANSVSRTRPSRVSPSN